MQDEIDAMKLATEVRILGVNQVDQDRDNELNCEGRDIPWLQETWEELVWASWKVEWRDVIILDGGNVKVDTFNLTTYDLRTQANYDELKARLVRAAG